MATGEDYVLPSFWRVSCVNRSRKPALSEVERGPAARSLDLWVGTDKSHTQSPGFANSEIKSGCPIHRAFCDGWDRTNPALEHIAARLSGRHKVAPVVRLGSLEPQMIPARFSGRKRSPQQFPPHRPYPHHLQKIPPTSATLKSHSSKTEQNGRRVSPS